jgi:hypothetical protein
MKLDEHALNNAAEHYSRSYGAEAYQKIGDDISIAVGSRQWDDAYVLQRVQWRLRKLERLRQIAAKLRETRERTSGPRSWHGLGSTTGHGGSEYAGRARTGRFATE